jgi:hypothetical protein
MYEGSSAETFAKGSTYQGQYTLGLRHSWGDCRSCSGAYYEGHWFRGLRDGRGMQQVSRACLGGGACLHGRPLCPRT